MKRNLLLFFLTFISALILIYPLGYVANNLIFNERGGAGFDVGPDQAMVDIFVGVMVAPPLLASFVFGRWGRSKWRWLLALILSLPSMFLFRWAGIYLLIPIVSFLVGTILSFVTNYLLNKTNPAK